MSNELSDENLGLFPALRTLIVEQRAATPRHASFLARRFAAAASEELALCNELAEQIIRLAGASRATFLAGYDFICDIQKKEELYFRRHKEYRLKSVDQAIQDVYSNRPYMQSYMRGLLMTQVFWSNHTAAMRFYLEEFLRHNDDNYDLLEIGPGHGLLFSRAVADPRAGSVTGWDISAASVKESRDALERLGASNEYSLETRDLFEPSEAVESFDAVVFSEVLEHLDRPTQALQAVRSVMRKGGRLYVNVPINSPAPDHVFLLRTPEEAVGFVESQGFGIERTAFFPATNYSLDAARRHALTITVCIVATKPLT